MGANYSGSYGDKITLSVPVSDELASDILVYAPMIERELRQCAEKFALDEMDRLDRMFLYGEDTGKPVGLLSAKRDRSA